MTRFLSLLAAVLAICHASAFMGTPVFSQQRTSSAQRSSGAGSMEMRTRVCDLLGKRANTKARVVTFSHKRIHKTQQVNLQWKRFYSDELGRKVRLRLSTKGIKTVNKMGSIDAAAKKFQVDLEK